MTGFVYLAALLAASGCMLLLDRRFALFFWRDAAAATVVTVVGVVFLLAWDVAGIASGIFLRGDAAIATGIVLAPEMPLEEPVFLVFLVLCTMVLYTGSARLIAARQGGKRSAVGWRETPLAAAPAPRGRERTTETDAQPSDGAS